jgi:NAD(P) transhydrogenase subunit alpha
VLVGVVKESFPGERRVALVPASIPPLAREGLGVLLEPGAGSEAGFPDEQYVQHGARLARSRTEVFENADILAQVRTPAANADAGRADVARLRWGQGVVGLADPLSGNSILQPLAAQGATVFALELMPRITRAQAMDVLSSMATIAGYKAVLLAAATLPRMFPLLMTAAGTITPARVFVIGAGVAGLQAIASARRLGATVDAYDVRAAVKEQVESLGAKFVELPLETSAAEGAGGYAKAQNEEFYRRQRDTMARVVEGSDVVITTAAVPGRKAPVLVTGEAVARMAPGSVVVDLAAERGGNCELTRPDETVVMHGVTILGPTNLASTVPYHASQMFAKNLSTFLLHLVRDGKLQIDLEDEITRETLVAREGALVHHTVRERLGLPALPAPPA